MAKRKTKSPKSKPPQEHTSDLLKSVITQIEKTDQFQLTDITSLLKARAFGLMILIFCIPNCLPIPNVAGLSALTGIPIGIIGLSLIAGRSQLWLPKALAKKKIPAKRLAAILKRGIPYIHKIEKLLHPRLMVMSSDTAQRFLGLAFVLLATVMSLPIPFGNFLPGFAMALIAIGLIERDGLIILAGLITGVTTIALALALGDALFSFMQSLW